MYKCFGCNAEFKEPVRDEKKPLVEKCPKCGSTLTKRK